MKGPFALRTPSGNLLAETVCLTVGECWLDSFPMMPTEFCNKYWKRWNASRAAAKRIGYVIVPVDIVEREHGRR